MQYIVSIFVLRSGGDPFATQCQILLKKDLFKTFKNEIYTLFAFPRRIIKLIRKKIQENVAQLKI